MTMVGGFLPAPAIPDPATAATLMALRDCLCHEAAKTHYGPVCRCYVAWGQSLPIQDGCACGCVDGGNGDAWVKLDTIDPDLATSGGSAAQGWCPIGWIATITLGLYRCVPVAEDDTVLPHQEITDISLALLSDMAALWRTISCCPAVTNDGVRVATWTPIDSAGGCAGGALTIQVPLAGVDGCVT